MNTITKDPTVKGALDGVRAATQQLHSALSDAVSKRGGAVKDDVASIPKMAEAAASSLKSSLGSQNESVKKKITDAIGHLEATQKHAAEGLKSSGQAFQSSLKQALSDSRAAARKVTEAVAATRSAQAKQ